MSYRRPPCTNQYWQSQGPPGPSSYQRIPPDDFSHRGDFDMQDFLPFNGTNPHLALVDGAMYSQGQGFPYNPQFPVESLEEPPDFRRLPSGTNQAFDQGPGWTQPPSRGHSVRLPSRQSEAFTDNHPASQLPDRRTEASQVQPEQRYQQPHPHLPQQPNPPFDQQSSEVSWRATPHPVPHEDHRPPPPLPGPESQQQEPPAPGSKEVSNRDSNQTKEVEEPLPNESQHTEQDVPVDSADKNNSGDESIILHPITKVPVKRKPNGTYELVGEEPKKANKKPKKANTPAAVPTKPRKRPDENKGDEYYCELCDVACSGPLNFKMHMSGAKHKLNEAKVLKGEKTVVRKNLNRKLRERYASRGPIPKDHNQEESPIVGLDYVTRVVFPDKNESEDLFECSLCEKKDLMAKCIYTHLVGKAHRKAYIRKLKPALAEQYSTIANVYNANGQLQRRQASDLTALLNSIVKTAAESDGPGEMQIRLCNEEDEDEEEEGPEDYGGEPYSSENEDFDALSYDKNPEDGKRSLEGRHWEYDRPLPNEGTSQHRLESPIPEARRLDPQPRDRIPPRDSSQPSGLGDSVTRLPSRTLSPEKLSSRVPPAPSSHSLPSMTSSVTRLSPRSSSPAPKAQSQETASSTPPVTRLPSTLSLDIRDANQTTGTNMAPNLPPLSEEQLRCYCSDVFIAQEYRRRFGDPGQLTKSSQPTNSQDNLQSSIGQAQAVGTSVEALLKSLSDTMVSSENDANMAMELTRALTQATLKYRLREKDYALQGRGGKK